MKEHMKYVDGHADEIDKLAKLQDQVSTVKNVMFENLDKALGRGEILTELSVKAEDLLDSVSQIDLVVFLCAMHILCALDELNSFSGRSSG